MMKMKKTLTSAALIAALSLSAATAGAEQSAANEYRTMFRSGNFYVEYKDNYTVRIIGETDGKRMERTKYESSMSWMAMLNPLGMLFGGSGPKHPEVLHKDGKYYQFTEKNKATVCDDSQLNDENLDPRQGWGNISQKLALPAELAVFYWEDPYRQKSAALAAPTEIWSGKKTAEGKEYDCDRYASRLLSASGSDEAQYVYDMLYENGVLKMIQSYVKRGNDEYPINTLSIKKIEGNVPENLFKIPKGTKIYAAGTGDMNDLLEQPAQIGVMEGL